MFSFLLSALVTTSIALSAAHLVLRKTKAEREAIDSVKKTEGFFNKIKQVGKLAWVFVYKFFYGLYKAPRNVYRQIAVEKFKSDSYEKKPVNDDRGEMRFRDLTDKDIYHGSAFQKFLDLIAGRQKYVSKDELNKQPEGPEAEPQIRVVEKL